MPAPRDSLADTMAASAGADLLVSHLLALATPLAAELRGLPWLSTALQSGDFFEVSAQAAARLGRRAVLLVGQDAAALSRCRSPDTIAVDYAPHAALFPRAAANVHHGGIGTTGQAMRAGKPMLVVPFAHDQPDNAWRVERLGISRTISRCGYTPERAARELRRILDDSGYGLRAEAVGWRVREEDGVGAACDAIEGLLAGSSSGG